MRNRFSLALITCLVAILAVGQGCGDPTSGKPVPSKEDANSIISKKGAMGTKTKAK